MVNEGRTRDSGVNRDRSHDNPDAVKTAKRVRPAPLNATVSAQMKKMPRHSTAPEMAVRRELHRRGMRYRVHPECLPGKPDIVFSKARIAVFIDGCFWHGCPAHGTMPKNNRDWWRDKIARNTERDAAKDAELASAGWLCLHFWEHEAPESVADAVQELWKSRRSGVS